MQETPVFDALMAEMPETKLSPPQKARKLLEPIVPDGHKMVPLRER